MSARHFAVIIPVLGRHHLTHDLLGDVAREGDLVEPIIVDNGGDYPALGSERVLRQQENLGWLRGSNVGLRHAKAAGYAGYVLLNNDTRLSRGFFAGLIRSAAGRRVGIVGPRYDDHFAHQHSDHQGPAATYRPRRRTRRVAFVDGTCALLNRRLVDEVGLLDEEHFGETGWGADVDLALRARRAGWKVVVTDRAFLSHATGSTAVQKHGDAAGYWQRGDSDLRRGLEGKWGPDWAAETGLAGQGARARLLRVLRPSR